MPWGMGGSGYGQPPQEDPLAGLTLEDFLGAVPPELAPPDAPSRGDQILALLGHSVQDTPMAPQGFGQGLISGLLRGAGGEGLRREGERTRLQQASDKRTAERAAANLEASRAYRTAKIQGMQGLRTEKRQAATEAAKERARTGEKRADYLRTSVPIPPNAPGWVKTLADSEGRIPQDTLARVLKPETGQNIAALSPEQAQLLWGLASTTGAFPPLGRGGIGGPAGQAMLNAGLAGAGGTTPADIGAGLGASRANYRADSGSLANLQKISDASKAFEQTALKNASVLEETIKKIPDLGAPWLNAPLRSVNRRLLGSVELAAFDAARQTVVPEFARLLNSPTASGQLTDQARQELERIVSGDYSVKQMLSVLKVLRRDAHNRVQSYEDQVKEIRGRIGAGGGAGRAQGQAPPQANRIRYKLDARGNLVPE